MEQVAASLETDCKNLQIDKYLKLKVILQNQ